MELWTRVVADITCSLHVTEDGATCLWRGRLTVNHVTLSVTVAGCHTRHTLTRTQVRTLCNRARASTHPSRPREARELIATMPQIQQFLRQKNGLKMLLEIGAARHWSEVEFDLLLAQGGSSVPGDDAPRTGSGAGPCRAVELRGGDQPYTVVSWASGCLYGQEKNSVHNGHQDEALVAEEKQHGIRKHVPRVCVRTGSERE